MPNITLSQLFVYPVKSLAGISVDTLALTEFGPANDRQWMVVNERGRFLTQRVLPQMCLISTELRHDGELWLKSSNNSESENEIAAPRGGGDELEVTVWRDTVRAQDCGNEIAEWLTTHIGTASRLVYLTKTNSRIAPASPIDYANKLAFADAYPLLLTNQSSLDAFNTHLENPIGMERFRPNMVVSGAAAYAEDNWQQLRIDGLDLKLASPCTRCVMPAINPINAEKQPEVIDVLNTTRRFGTETRFGQNIVYQTSGSLSVGATIEILE